jgi:hypothetical protein
VSESFGARLLLHQDGLGADPRLGAGSRVAAAHKPYEFLRSRKIAAVAALLRHRAANFWPFGFVGSWFVDPQFARAVTLHQTLDNRLTGFAGRDFAVNIKVAIAHDCYPLLMLRGNAQVPGTVAHASIESATAILGFTGIGCSRSRFFTRQRLKSRIGC